MSLLSTGFQVSQAVRNVGRLRHILGVFVKYGFKKNIQQLGLPQDLTNASAEDSDGISVLTLPERLKYAFEELGPTFVKLGQLMSDRPDLLPDEYIQEFKKLQDNVTAVPFDQIRSVLDGELKQDHREIFMSFDERPLGAASIGQVYAATLRSGEDVVVKVQRPDINELIQSDLGILHFLAKLIEKYIPETRLIGPKRIVEEFSKTLTHELNYVIEANTTQRIADNLAVKQPRIRIPKIYRTYTTKKILTLERIHGLRVTDRTALQEHGIDPKELAQIGVRAFFQMVLVDGLFHGDLHGGNLFALKNPLSGETQLGVIDFGIVGRLSEKSRDAFCRMIFALVTEDYESLCYEYAELASFDVSIDFESFQNEIQSTLSPYMGLALKEIQIGKILMDATRIATQYKIRVPSDWMIVFKAIFSLEGLGRQLDEDFDLLELGSELLKTAVRDRYSWARLSRDMAVTLRDATSLLQTLPRQLRWMLRKFNSNDFAFEVKFREFSEYRQEQKALAISLQWTIMVASLFIAGALSLSFQSEHQILGYPIVSVIFLGLGFIGLLIWLLKKIRL